MNDIPSQSEFRARAPLRGALRKRDSRLWRRHPEDWYVEPEWVSDRLFASEQFEGLVYDPACGLGRIVAAARRAGLVAVGADLRGRAPAYAICDFLTSPLWTPDNIVCNPPYGYIAGICEDFVCRSLQMARGKVAMLLPANWVSGDRRSRWLKETPLAVVYFITPRPSMPPGPVIMADVAPGNGTTDYAWFVWTRGYPPGQARVNWIHRD